MSRDSKKICCRNVRTTMSYSWIRDDVIFSLHSAGECDSSSCDTGNITFVGARTTVAIFLHITRTHQT